MNILCIKLYESLFWKRAEKNAGKKRFLIATDRRQKKATFLFFCP